MVENFTGLFNSKTPDLTGIATLNADRGYLRLHLLAWWLSTGGHVLGTVMRQDFLKYTFDKSEDFVKRTGQMNISQNTHKVVHQATLRSKSSNKAHTLTNTAYASGHSSTVNLGLHSEFHERHWDFVAARPAEAACSTAKPSPSMSDK